MITIVELLDENRWKPKIVEFGGRRIIYGQAVAFLERGMNVR